MTETTMKLSEIRPCDSCGGGIAPVFHVIEVKFAALDQQAVNEVLGLSQFWGHRSLKLAEVFAPNSDKAVRVSEDDALNTKIFLCTECFVMKRFSLVNARLEKAKKAVAAQT